MLYHIAALYYTFSIIYFRAVCCIFTIVEQGIEQPNCETLIVSQFGEKILSIKYDCSLFPPLKYLLSFTLLLKVQYSQ